MIVHCLFHVHARLCAREISICDSTGCESELFYDESLRRQDLDPGWRRTLAC